MILSPGERRIYRIGSALFRVWADRPDATAEIYRSGEWIWTPILTSGSIMSHPRAVALSEREVEEIELALG